MNLQISADAQPTEAEKEMFLEVEAVLKKGQTILKEISQYRGASKEIREVLFFYNNMYEVLITNPYFSQLF